MPTGARLVSALFFAGLAYIATQFAHAAYEANLGYAVRVGAFPYIVTAFGALCGWIIMGKRVGEGLRFAVSSGVLTSVAILFWGLLSISLYEMIILSTKMRYGGATEATIDVFRIGLGYAQTILTPKVILTLFVGGLAGGWAADWANRRYR